MRSKKILATAMAAILLTSQVAWAQGDSPGANWYNNNQYQRSNDRDHRGNDGRQGNRNDRNNRDNNRDNYRYYGHAQHGERGGGPDQMYYRGGRLPPQYRGQQYVVEDWRGHRLSAPPRGYQWVQSGGDYLLVAIATGVILNLILNH